MPEALAVLFVFVVAVAAYVSAKLAALDPSNHNAQAELVRLRQQRAWLDERLQQAWRENWDQDMRGRIADEINEVDAQLATASRTTKRTP